jgi:phospholipid/cholesterol/gamma-HCH transport system substrate-binding protein
METDKRYFIEGLFIIGFVIAATLFSVWLASTGHRDDVIYRIRFAESVSGLSVGDPVKFQGVDVGTVKAIALDPGDPRLVQVEVRLRKEAPVKTDTKATLKLKGITGLVFVELDGAGPEAKTLVSATPAGTIPEIPSGKSQIADVLDQLPKVVRRLSALESKASKVLTDVGEVVEDVKDNPLVTFGNKKKAKERETK